ncbi:uncharacterized protein LOC143240814 [Tachypleus tridentatus]|uniref:uncharacterized protein LOC143240814 n=1 Tax=Tachypleus tridentatus TaxID=6853 RepID=UPI003FD4BD86
MAISSTMIGTSYSFCIKFHFKQSEVSMYRRGTTRERVPCQICNKSFERKQDFDAHMNLHVHTSYRKKYYCSVCNKAFLWKNNMYAHRKNAHKLSTKTVFG